MPAATKGVVIMGSNSRQNQAIIPDIMVIQIAKRKMES